MSDAGRSAKPIRGGSVDIEADELLPGELDEVRAKSWADAAELDSFDQFVDDFWSGRLTPEDFRKLRLQQGVYGQRQTDVQMIRTKIPWGGLTALQLECLADIAAGTPRGVGHVTTRQNVQFHFVPLAESAAILRTLADVGLTTREACGNTVRNVTVGHCAGICAAEVFDPTPYADAVARFLLRNAMNQSLPRKFKIAFSGCDDDSGLTPIHDVGARAVVRRVDGGTERGFTLAIAGGLGPAPRLAEALEAFTPVDDLLVTIAAIVRVFDRHGNRGNRNLARLKFVAKKLGMPALRALILKEREELRVTMEFPAIESWEEQAPGREAQVRGPLPLDDPEFRRWHATNVIRQKQAGYVAVNVRLPLGDATAEQFRVLARASREFGDGRARSTNQQNVTLRWVDATALGDLFSLLSRAGLAAAGAERLVDVTSCPGADTCQLGITSSRGLAQVLSDTIEKELGALADHAGLRIKISGCPNSCGQHHIASIGFFGGARKFGGDQAPTYQMLIGGAVGAGLGAAGARYGKPLARIPAKNVPAVVQALLGRYRAENPGGESFIAWVDRVGIETLKDVVEPWTELAPRAESPDSYLDWGASEAFKAETGAGECAA